MKRSSYFDIAFSECFVKLLNISVFHVPFCCTCSISALMVLEFSFWPEQEFWLLDFSLEIHVIFVMFCWSTVAHFVLVYLGNPRASATIWNPAFSTVNETPSDNVDIFLETWLCRKLKYRLCHQHFSRILFPVGGQNKLCRPWFVALLDRLFEFFNICIVNFKSDFSLNSICLLLPWPTQRKRRKHCLKCNS